MDLSSDQSPTRSYPETMDFLSHAWCNFAVQTLQPDIDDKSLALVDNQMIITKIESSPMDSMKLERSSMMDDGDVKHLPPWKTNDVKSWIWMQQAMHPELNYNGYFKKRWISAVKKVSIKKWVKEAKQRRREEERLKEAEVHAAVAVAGVAAAVAATATAAADSSHGGPKEAAVASAAALVASHCAKLAEAVGADRRHLTCIITSAITATSPADIFTLAAAAKTSLKGATTLRKRSGCKNKINGIAPVLPLDETSHEPGFDSESYRATLAQGFELGIETPDGDYLRRSVSIVLNSESKVVLQIRKLGLLKRKKESIIQDLHAELYKESEEEELSETCYLLVLTTSKGMFKLDMGDDYHRYKTWATTINHMMLLSSSVSKYQQCFYEN